MDFEHVILGNLIFREDYSRKVIPFLKDEYFHNPADKLIFETITEYVNKYNSFPSKEAIMIDITSRDKIDQNIFDQSEKFLNEFNIDPETQVEWLLDKTEEFCKQKSVYNGIMKSIQILDNQDKNFTKDAIPQILSDALAVSFDTNIGHSYVDDSESRWDYYHNVTERVPFDLEYMNKITKGGIPKKSLSIILGGIHGGKSLFMCHFAAANLLAGKNVLYISMEMSEESIAERIDANLMDIRMDDIQNIPKDVYLKKIDRIRNKSTGKLVIKEFPTSSAGVTQFRHLLNELKLKKKFIPDIIYIDYLNICCSSRVKYSAAVNSYTYVKAIAEEIRALAFEYKLPIMSATQLTRGAFSATDVDMDDVSESFALGATADFIFAIINTEELIAMNQILVKQLKNRFGDFNKNKRFIIGIDRGKMKLFDVEQTAQDGIMDDDTPVMDNTGFGKEDKERSKQKRNFQNFK